MQVFSVKTQLYYEHLKNEPHVSATVSSHHKANPKNVTEGSNTVAVLVDLGSYKICT